MSTPRWEAKWNFYIFKSGVLKGYQVLSGIGNYWPVVIFFSGALLFALAGLDAFLFFKFSRREEIGSFKVLLLALEIKGESGKIFFFWISSFLTPFVVMQSWILINTIPGWGLVLNVLIVGILTVVSTMGYFALGRRKIGTRLAMARILGCLVFEYSMRAYYNMILGPGGF